MMTMVLWMTYELFAWCEPLRIALGEIWIVLIVLMVLIVDGDGGCGL